MRGDGVVQVSEREREAEGEGEGARGRERENERLCAANLLSASSQLRSQSHRPTGIISASLQFISLPESLLTLAAVLLTSHRL